MNHPRLLGIDYGTKRVGIAISDESRKFALPHSVIANGSDSLIGEIEKITSEFGIKEIVIGESKNYKGEDNTIQPAILDLKKQLETKGFVIHLEPEFMTSQQAERLQGKNDKLDSSAAALILQSFLDRVKTQDRGEDKPSKISFDDFKKVQIQAGQILSAEKIPDTDKLLKLSVDFNEKDEMGTSKPRQIISGISLYFPDPAVLVGKTCMFVTNLEPRTIKGYESDGMLFAVSTEDGKFSLLEPGSDIPPGTSAK